jgi:polyphosphate kinase
MKTPAKTTPPHSNGQAAANAPCPGAPLDEAGCESGVTAGLASSRPDAAPGFRMFNRDLSWLEFNRRVLQQACDERTPLLERVRFLAIFSSNLDEFVMKRIGALKHRMLAGLTGPDQDGLSASLLLAALRANIRELQQRQAAAFERGVRPALAQEGIDIAPYEALDANERRWLDAWFRVNVFPVLTPLSVDPGHRFPFISNLSRNFGVLLLDPGKDEPVFARVKIPSVIPQWIHVPEKAKAGADAREPATLSDVRRPENGRGRFVNLRDIIRSNLKDLFPGMQILEVIAFRVTRDSEAEPGTDDDGDNLLELVEAQLKRRRFAQAVRIEIAPDCSDRMMRHLLDELELGEEDVDEREGLLDYTTLVEVAEMHRPELQWPRWSPVVPRRLADTEEDIFSIIRKGDILVHHPYESFAASAERFIAEAARDPHVLAIKQTIYRTSRDSVFVSSLIRAAEMGKQVACLIELRARFDEQSNVKFARMLEKAGAHVAYGVVGMKTHCKAALVVRQEGDGLRTYAHLGTGNYHPRTAQLYTDLGVFTCNPAITDDTIELFNLLTGRSRQDTFETLLVAPTNMKPRFIAMIERETHFAKLHAAGKSKVGGRIIAKMNAMADHDVAEKLYEASQAGVEIVLFVRGFCCLRPGVPGLSENIRVISIVGRFLEHSRFFYFGNGSNDPTEGEWYIASADWMYRNLQNRVEAACPILDKAARARLHKLVAVMLADHRCAWDLMPDGSYAERTPSPDAAPDSPERLGTFGALMQEARL